MHKCKFCGFLNNLIKKNVNIDIEIKNFLKENHFEKQIKVTEKHLEVD